MRARLASRSPSPWGTLRCLVIALSCLWGSVTAFALDPARPLTTLAQHTWRSEDGLLQDTASALLESKDGFLWIGTGAGLVRFDGATFDHYSRLTLPHFEHNAVQCLAEGSDGALWIGTTEPGLYRLVRGEIRALGAAEGLPDRPIHRLLRDGHGILWAAPSEGPLLRFDGTRFQPVPSDAAQLRIRALAMDAEGTLWVGTAGSGLWRLREDRLALAALATADITALETLKAGDILVGTRSQGLLVFSEGRLEAPAWARDLPRKPVSSLLQDREGSLWVGLEQSGLFRRTPNGRWEASPRGGGFPRTPLALLEDSSGALWSGSEERGLEVLHPVPFQSMPIPGGDAEAPARMVCQDPQGTVWCLTGDQGLAMVREGRLERLKPAHPGAPVTAIWPRAVGGLWVGAQNGELLVLEQGRFRRVRPPDGPGAEPILSLYEDPDQVLWVATPRRGLLKLAPGTLPLFFPAINGVQAMAGGGSGPLYLASRTQGLGLLEGGEIRWLGRTEGLGSSGVLSLRLDPDGTLWIGTIDGLRCYRNGAFRNLSESLGPLRLAIHAILEDGARRMWLSTVQGVFQIPREALLNNPDLASAVPAVVFDHHDGLPSRETSGGAQPAAWLVRDGDLYFPTSRGLARLDGRTTAPQGPPLRLHFLKAESDETVLPDTHPIRVPAGTHRFEVYYTATSLTRADKVRFRYRLDGWEPTWNEVGDRRFSAYSNLPPGRYRFVLKAWRLDEASPPQEASVEVIVEPFLYQRPAFWALCGLVILAFGGWLHYLRLQQLEARSAVLSERNRMAREIHDHLAQGFTGVLLQLEAAEAKLARLPGDATPVLTRIEHARNLAVSSLQEARRSVMALRPRKPEGADLLGAIRLLSDRLLAGTEIQVELAVTGQPRRLRERLEEELLRMAQELLTNALRHGKARWVRVVLQFEPRQVSLSIEDDGKGFDPSADVAGYGMRSIREGIKQLRGRLDIDSSQGLGSRITITLPTRRWRP
ncbi:MAG TPA: two-component regulator propeller domain-containing protein [Geothrix sp.]|nr:two-component regulator propeller domain-containing protein [Geothrix sp.]